VLPVELLGATVRRGVLDEPSADPCIDERASSSSVRLVADRRTAQLEVDGTIRIQVDDGQTVVVDTDPGIDDDEVVGWLHGTVAALVLGQQGRSALHASTVAIGAGAVALAGRRGAGKSTTALELTRRGHRLVTDDVSPVDDAGVGPPMVVPFGRALHVWPEAAVRLDVDVSDALPIDADSAKLSLPVTTVERTCLTHVVVLDPDEDADGVTCTDLAGFGAAEAIGSNAYRVEVLNQLWPHQLFRWTTWLPTVVAVHLVRRPEVGWSVEEVATAVEALLDP